MGGRMPRSGNSARFFALRLRLWDLVTACGAVLATLSILGFLGRFWWAFDLFAHFRLQYFAGLGAVALALLLVRRFSASVLFAVLSILNAGTVLPLFLAEPTMPVVGARLQHGLLINVNSETGEPAKVGGVIRQANPDFLVLEEINERWVTKLSAVLHDFPFNKVVPRDDNFGIGLFSKYPFLSVDARELGDAEVPSIFAQLELPGGRVNVFAVHALPPGSAENSRLRDEQLAALVPMVKEARFPVLVVGDLNATPWGFSFRELLRRSGLKNAAKGHGVLTTWPVFFPMAGIPLDHCLYSDGIQIGKIGRGPNVRSDHFPLVFDFYLITTPAPVPARPPSAPVRAL
jgi:endonuclease/exonuclease/phosphatase (EEP) superfamily protein YafD